MHCWRQIKGVACGCCKFWHDNSWALMTLNYDGHLSCFLTAEPSNSYIRENRKGGREKKQREWGACFVHYMRTRVEDILLMQSYIHCVHQCFYMHIIIIYTKLHVNLCVRTYAMQMYMQSSHMYIILNMQQYNWWQLNQTLEKRHRPMRLLIINHLLNNIN